MRINNISLYISLILIGFFILLFILPKGEKEKTFKQISVISGGLDYNLYMITKSYITTEIEFAESQAHEFKNYIAPMLRFVVAVNPEVDRDVFIEACVDKGYHAETAKQCFYKGRKWARDNS